MNAEIKEHLRKIISHLWNYITEGGESVDAVREAFEDLIAKNQVGEVFKESIAVTSRKHGVSEAEVVEALKEVIPQVTGMKTSMIGE